VKEPVAFEDFVRLQIVAARIVEVRDFERARVPSYRVRIDCGEAIGERESSLQAKSAYTPEDLLGTLVVAVVNLPEKNIAGFKSQALVLGVPAEDGSLSLLRPDRGAAPGGDVY
jgi:tRNA-binding protein